MVAGFTGGRTHHELLLIQVGPDAAPIPEGRRIGMYHFGLKIGDSDDELRAAQQQLREAGVPVLGASDHTVSHSLYIADPDGNEIELFIDARRGLGQQPGGVRRTHAPARALIHRDVWPRRAGSQPARCALPP